MHGRRRRTTRKGKSKSAADRRQDRAIARINRTMLRWSQYNIQGTGGDSYHSFPLVIPNTWQSNFQANFRANQTDRCFVKSFDIMSNITVGISGVASFSPMHYCMFVVQIKKQAQMQTIARLGPSLATVTEGIDYTYQPIGTTVGQAHWQLNPAIYRVLASRRGMVGDYSFEDLSADATPVSNIRDANKNHRRS